jgi:hypothetical protein
MSDTPCKSSNSELSSTEADRDSVSCVQVRAKDECLPVPRTLGKLRHLVAHILLAFFGCGAVAWGIYGLPIFARQAPIERVAMHVIAGDPFKPEVLAAFMPQVESAEQAAQCRPAASHSAAIIRVRFAERAIVDGENIDAQLSALRDSVQRSLACSPADSFLWFILYWVESVQNGFQPKYLELLRLSYELGPNEGWIAVRRNAYALAIFPKLAPDLGNMVLAEFPGLLESGFFEEAVQNFIGPGWPERNLLLLRLRNIPERYRQDFARTVYKRGYEVTVPGIAPMDPRPWD